MIDVVLAFWIAISLLFVTMIHELVYGFVGLVLLAYAAEYLFSLRDDPQEPPRLQSKVPLIGHVLGLMKSGPSYHSQLRYDNCFRGELSNWKDRNHLIRPPLTTGMLQTRKYTPWAFSISSSIRALRLDSCPLFKDSPRRCRFDR